MEPPFHPPRSFRRRHPPFIHARDPGDSLLIGPGGQIVAAEPAKEDPRVTGLLPEDRPHDGGHKSSGEENPRPQAQDTPSSISPVRDFQPCRYPH